MVVSKGYVDFKVDGRVTRLTPDMEPLRILPGQRHAIHKPPGIAAVFHERALPDPEGKMICFKDMFSHGDFVSTNFPSIARSREKR